MTTTYSNLKIERHPISHFLRSLSPLMEAHTEINFSIYHYHPQSFSDERLNFYIPLRDLSFDWLEDTLQKLKPGQELALHSAVVINDEVCHIPMIDCGSKTDTKANSALLKTLSERWNFELKIYSSGRSFHGYGDRLISDKNWVRYMGELLLLNLPGKAKVIDTRWIGHRLIAGYSSLRWSCNSSQYKKFPTLVGRIEDLSHANR